MNNKSLEALHQNIIGLSKSQPIHYEVAAKELSETHLAILKVKNAELVEALKEISEGSGRFSKDPLRHAENCIEDMKKIAIAALTREPAAL